jgi:hypothetical protein
VFCAAGLAFTQSSLASTFTWSGGGASSGWSLGANWSGGVAPSDVGDALVFPAAPSGCTSSTSCYSTSVDTSGYSVASLAIDDGVGYNLTGDTFTLDGGGLTATTSSSTFDPAQISAPIELGAPQTWSIDGGGASQGQLDLYGLSGSEALSIDVSNAGFLDLDDDDADVGDVTIAGADASQTGLEAYNNGALELAPTGGLNGDDLDPIQLTDAAVFGDGELGPVTATGGVLSAGGGESSADPTGTMSVNGALSLDGSSALQFAIGSNDSASELTSTGAIDLGGATLDITGAAADTSCPVVSNGQSFTLISTTSTITGAFANVTGGDDLPLDCDWASPPVVHIDQTATTVTATVVAAGTEPTTTTTLTASPSPTSTNQTVTLTATVTIADPYETPAGSVTFESAGQPIPGCNGIQVTQAGSTYEAACQTSFGAASSPVELTAGFIPSPDPAQPSESSPIELTVALGATTTALVRGVSTTQSIFGYVPLGILVSGQLVTPEALVGTAAVGGVLPTGTVAFLDNGNTIAGCGAVPLNGSVAACGTSVAVTGTGIRAVYSGDGNFAGSSATDGLFHQQVPSPVSSTRYSVTLSQLHLSGHHVFAMVDCTTPETACYLQGSLTVKETRKRGKLTAVSASRHTTTVVVGALTPSSKSVPAGSSTIELSLNKAGLRLLAARHRLVAKLVVTSDPNSTTEALSLYNGDVTFTQPVQKKKAH